MLIAYLGIAGLTDVGYLFYGVNETPLGARVSEEVVDVGEGYYSVSVAPPSNVASVRWDSLSEPAAVAREYFDSLRVASGVNVQSSVTMSGSVLNLIRGNDYHANDGRSFDMHSQSWPIVTGGSVVFRFTSGLSSTVILTVAAQIIAARSIRVELAAGETEMLTESGYNFDATATLVNGRVVTLVRGRAVVTAAT